MRKVVLLGSTGSIGTQTLDVISTRRDRFDVVGLSASGGSIELLARQIVEFRPAVVALSRASKGRELMDALYAVAAERGWAQGEYRLPKLLLGPHASTELAAMECDVVLNAITGAAGLEPTLAALRAGTTLALANKESLVIGGCLVTEAARPGQIVAVDSEHSAFAQALRGGRRDEVRRLVLTASGGPFRGRRRDELHDVTPAQALAHPTWNMGRVVTINSATLVNKGLELLEAALLYDVDLDDIVVTVHPQSIVHSMVEYRDGSTLAQLGPSDMRVPIASALAWPARMETPCAPLDLAAIGSLTFFKPDEERFPATRVAREAVIAGGAAPAVLNAANEIAVAAFLAGQIAFTRIVRCAEDVLARGVPRPPVTLEEVIAVDREARIRAAETMETVS